MTSLLPSESIAVVDKLRHNKRLFNISYGCANKKAVDMAFKEYEAEWNHVVPVDASDFGDGRLFELWDDNDTLIGLLSLDLSITELDEGEEITPPALYVSPNGVFIHKRFHGNNLGQTFGETMGCWLTFILNALDTDADRIVVNSDFMTRGGELFCYALASPVESWAEENGFEFSADWGY